MTIRIRICIVSLIGATFAPFMQVYAQPAEIPESVCVRPAIGSVECARLWKAEASGAQPTLQTDFNADRVVDMADFLLWEAAFLSAIPVECFQDAIGTIGCLDTWRNEFREGTDLSQTTVPAEFRADVNGDGVITLVDFEIIRRAFFAGY